MRAILVAALLLVLAPVPALAVSAKRISQPATAAKEPAQKSVNLDATDEDVRVILASMQKQCGIKNLVIDPQVQARGTFYFRNVPCRAAFRTVFESLGLAGSSYGTSVMTVGGRR